MISAVFEVANAFSQLHSNDEPDWSSQIYLDLLYCSIVHVNGQSETATVFVTLGVMSLFPVVSSASVFGVSI